MSDDIKYYEALKRTSSVMIPCATGQWVRREDYEALEKRIIMDRLIERAKKLGAGSGD